MGPNSDSHDPHIEAGGNLKIIDLEFETLRQFREVMAPRLAYEGFFVATNTPLAKGTPARFRFLLPDGFVLVEGTAVVAWNRVDEERPDSRAGMALLFNELEHQSREIIDELIDFHIATGGDPFEVSAAAGEAGDIGIDALARDRAEVSPPQPEPELETVPDSGTPNDSKANGVLPDWLAEVAEQHDVDLSADRTVPIGGTDKLPETPDIETPQIEIPDMEIPEIAVPDDVPEIPKVAEVTEPILTDFDISLMPEDEGPDVTPFQAVPDVGSEITMPSSPKKKRRGFRLWLLLAAAIVIAGASAGAWWYVNRVLVPTTLEPMVIVEQDAVPEQQVEVIEQPTAEVADSTEPATAPPLEVTEPEPEPMSEIEGSVTGPATRVLMIDASDVGSTTVITVRANGELSEDSIRISPLKDPPRVWIRVFGIETFYRPSEIEVGTLEVERVRVGHHPEETPQSLYVVVDLENAAAGVREHSIDGDTLRVVVAIP